MSPRHRFIAGQHRPPPLAALVSLAILTALSGATLASAQPPVPQSRSLSAADARSAGVDIPIVARDVPGGTLVEVLLPPTADRVDMDRRTGPRLLALASDGSAAAMADRIEDPLGSLTITHADGSQVRPALTGVAGAAFAPDGSWVAAVDARGVLWRIGAQNGDARRLADGPYAGVVSFTSNGELALIEVPSVEAPYASRLVRLDPANGTTTAVAGVDEPLVIGALALDDGRLAAVVHPFGGGVAIRVLGGGRTSPFDLDPAAIDVGMSRDGRWVAYAVLDEGVYMLDTRDGSTRFVGSGVMPRFAPDASTLLLARGEASALVDLEGRNLGTFSSAAAWIGCGGVCEP